MHPREDFEPFIAWAESTDGIRLQVARLVGADAAATWLADAEGYHGALRRESMWIRASAEFGSIEDHLREWAEFMTDWRAAHPAGVQGSFMSSFGCDPVEALGFV